MLANETLIRIHISEDEITAYLTLGEPLSGETFTLEQLQKELQKNGIVKGVDEQVLQRMLEQKEYEKEMKIASGHLAVDGTDGWYEYNFRQNVSKKPQIREDGTVDYWSMNLIESVVAGQVIAIYNPAKTGENGMTVTGKVLQVKIGKELSPLKGRGFERNNDNLTYVASIDGKIEVIDGRININNFHEIFGNADFTVGNIEFGGDVVIHGNVCTGISVHAGGTVTIDGVVESAKIWAGKDIVLRGGVLGNNRAEIFAKGNIYARFVEYAKVKALGSIEADYFLQCEVESRQQIRLVGKKGLVIGGHVHAVCGIEANEIGNDTEVKSRIEVGVGEAVYQRIKTLQQQLLVLQEEIKKIDSGLAKFSELAEKHSGIKANDHIRTQLMRIRIRNTSIEKEGKAELEDLYLQAEQGHNATIKIHRIIYPGTFLVIGYAKLLVKEQQVAVEYVKIGDRIMLRGEEIVE